MSGFWDVVGWGSGWFTKYVTSSLIFKDNVRLYFGDGKDTSLYWDGTNFYIDTLSGAVYLQDEVYAATHLRFGDNDKIFLGTGNDIEIYFDATDLRIDATAGSIKMDSTTEYEFMWSGVFGLKMDDSAVANYAAATNTDGKDVYLELQSALDNNKRGGGLTITAGAKHGSGTDGIVTVQTGRFWVYDQAGTSDVGISIDSGTTTANVATIGTEATLSSGLEIATGAGDINLDSTGAIILDMTTVSSMAWAGVTGLKFDDGAIAAYAYTADTDGPDILFATASGGAHTSNNPDGGDFIVQPGAKGAGGSGSAGVFRVRDPASTDALTMYHTGSQAILSATHYILLGAITRELDDTVFALGSDGDWTLKNVTSSPTNHLELGEGATPALAFYGSTLVAQGFAAAADTAGNDLFLATQTAGAHTSNNPRGGNLAIELGTGTGTGVQGILSVNGPVTITPASAVAALALDTAGNDVNSLTINTEAASNHAILMTAKYGISCTVDTSGGRAANFYRNMAEAGSLPLVVLTDDHATNQMHTLQVRNDSGTVTAAAAQLLRNGITTTSTDALLIENSTVSLTGERVQMSPRIRWRSHAWDIDGSVNSTDDWIAEVLPATANVVTSTWRLGRSLDGGAYAYQLTLASSGVLTAASSIKASTGSFVGDEIKALADDTTLTVQSRDFTVSDSAVEMATGTWTHSSGEGVAVEIKPTWNVTGTGNATCLLINSTSTAAPNTYMLFECKDDTVSRFSVSGVGVATAAAVHTGNLRSTANDVTLGVQTRDFTVSDSAVEMATGTFSGGNGTQFVGLLVKPTYNDGGATSAAATDFVVSRTETDLGTGAQLLADFGTTTDGTYANHTSLFSVDNVGRVANKILNFNDGADLTIAAGSVTATNSFHRIVVQGGAGSGADDLDTIVAGNDGDIIVIAPKTSGANDTVTAKDGAGNLVTAGDFAMDHVNDRMTLMYSTADSGWVELSRSSNA